MSQASQCAVQAYLCQEVGFHQHNENLAVEAGLSQHSNSEQEAVLLRGAGVGCRMLSRGAGPHKPGITG